MISKDKTALLIVAHGSTVNPDSSAPTLAHAAEIRRRKVFADVGCAFWKEEPSLRDAVFLFDPESIHEVYVVPNFISEGYFTQTVIPRELELNGRVTKRSNGQLWKYCEPAGNHPSMTGLLLKRAHHVAPDVDSAGIHALVKPSDRRAEQFSFRVNALSHLQEHRPNRQRSRVRALDDFHRLVGEFY